MFRMRLAISRVCLSLGVLCFMNSSAAQSTSSSDDPIPASEVAYRHPVLETSRFIAYLLEIPPRHATLMHRHDRDILTIFVSGTKTTSTFYGHEPVTDAIPSGDSRFRTAGFTHASRNDDSVVFRAVILEFAKSQGAVRAQSDEHHYCNEGAPTTCVIEKQQLCTEGFCVTEIRMAPGAIRKASGRAASYAMIPVNDCELSIAGDDLASVHEYRGGAIQYFESANSSWRNLGQAEAHLVLVNFDTNGDSVSSLGRTAPISE
jgi:hypothetical protein